MTSANLSSTNISRLLPDWPLVIWLIIISLSIGLLNGMDANELVSAFNGGWGYALGEFALILLPSFTLSAVLSRKTVGDASLIAAFTSPVAGAGMICPDTAYAALSPVAGRRKLAVAMGAYSGFKLLFPAGPLIVATGLGVTEPSLLIYGLLFLFPVWAAGILWVSFAYKPISSENTSIPHVEGDLSALVALFPFGLLFGLLIFGWMIDFTSFPAVDFFTSPKGALILSAAFALISIKSDKRRECLEEAIRRSALLLFIIGAASAFGAILTASIDVQNLLPAVDGALGIIGLFTLTAMFKLMQGSSMATFAAISPVAAPIVAASTLPPASAVFAICLGSFIAILPNDSFYWLVRKDALATSPENKSIKILAGGAIMQALFGLFMLLALYMSGLI